jgi:hypothetical protein
MTRSCPSCLNDTSPEVAFRCTSCKAEDDPEASETLGFPVRTTPVVVLPPSGSGPPPDGVAPAPGRDPHSTQTQPSGLSGAPLCPTCGKQLYRRVCARCRRDLPDGYAQADGSTTIVLCGARDAGKTVYIDVVAAYLHELPAMLRPMGIQLTVRALDEATVAADTESQQRMWEDGQAAKRTARVGDGAFPPPRVYGLTRRDGDQIRRHVLILRDVPGEDLDNPERNSIPAFAFMGRADLVMLLVDPFQIRAIRDRLSDLVPIGDQRYSDPVKVLRNVRMLQKGQTSGKTAVVLAKFDALHKLAEIRDQYLSPTMRSPGFAYYRDPGALRPVYHHADGLLLHEEIKSLLELLGAGTFLSEVELELVDPRFFAVSALGHQPRGTALASSGVTAFRVMDPIHWVLDDSGLLGPPQAQRRQPTLPPPEFDKPRRRLFLRSRR